MSRKIDIIYKGSAAITENTEDHVTLTVSDGGNKSGDVNADGEFNVADAVTLQKWLLGAADVTLNDWKTANLCKDDRLDVFDLCLIKRELVKSTYIS